MRARTLHTDGEQRTVAIVLSTGDEAMACLKAFAEREHVTAAQFTAIGAFAGATLGYFDWTTKEYRRNAVDEQVEVASLTGISRSGRTATRRCTSIACLVGATGRRWPDISSRARCGRPSKSF